MAMTTPLDAAAVVAAHRARGNTEYQPLLVVPGTGLPDFLAEAGETVVPPAHEFLARAGLLAQRLKSVQPAA